MCVRIGLELEIMWYVCSSQFLSLCFRISGFGAFVIIRLWKITLCQSDISGEVYLQILMLPMKEKMGNLSSLKVLVLFDRMISMEKKWDFVLWLNRPAYCFRINIISGLQGTGTGCSLNQTWSQVTRRL